MGGQDKQREYPQFRNEALSFFWEESIVNRAKDVGLVQLILSYCIVESYHLPVIALELEYRRQIYFPQSLGGIHTLQFSSV